MNTSNQIDKNLFLVTQTLEQKTVGHLAPAKVNHIMVIDCSGSMYGELPQIRSDLKKKLPKLIAEGDTLSIIWFSGRGEFGALIEAEPVSTLKDLKDVNAAIDRWLKPMGLTGFKEPLLEVGKLVTRVQKKNKNVFSLFFMTDGGENQWSKAEVLTAVENAGATVASSTFVEYGYYADRNLIAAMAAKAGGQHIHAASFVAFDPILSEAMGKSIMGGKRVEAKVDGDPIGGFVYEIRDREIITYEVNGGKVLVSESTSAIHYMAPTSPRTGVVHPNPPKHGSPAYEETAPAMYAAMSVFAVRMKPDVVYPLLKALGDAKFITQFSTCFGKQKYSQFMDQTAVAAFATGARLTQGYNPNLVPPDDAFTVFDLLQELSNDEDTRVLLDHPSFKYSRISRKRVDANEALSAKEQEELMTIQVKMQNERNTKKLREYQKEIDAILSTKGDALKFEATEEPDGYYISSLTYNEHEPNISILVKKQGTVDLRDRFAKADAGTWKLAFRKEGNIDAFPTFIYRNYAIVQNGLVNVDILPVDISKDLYRKLAKAGVKLEDTDDGVTTIDLRPLPILNRKMVQSISAKERIELEYKITKLRAAQKVYNAYQKDLFPSAKLQGWTDRFGAEATAWLKEQGFTEYSGFGPKMVNAESTDFIVGKELDIKLKGYSALPTLKEVKERVKSGKALNGPTQMMADVIEEVDMFMSKNPAKLHEAWLTGKAKATTAETRALAHQSSQMLFSIIVGQTWFKEFATLDDKTMDVKIGKEVVSATCELKEINIKV